jgi:hypothetical protein
LLLVSLVSGKADLEEKVLANTYQIQVLTTERKKTSLKFLKVAV